MTSPAPCLCDAFAELAQQRTLSRHVPRDRPTGQRIARGCRVSRAACVAALPNYVQRACQPQAGTSLASFNATRHNEQQP
ncbi:hypothetical protein [Burkholderia lata]|uniref:hypothetical protein n=1 Tax=Burkholderia lata (strain ATCC 17760 / DSM 23089 / LMG 22485 / NCIMB 9086 / R18194 / 383) TaxID=482957 RepID=UPI0015819290|nr:hypothetical protein [Burkholderia lata]